MGVDTGKNLHVVILRCDDDDATRHHLVHLATYHNFSVLDALMERFQVERCVIDALPEIHATRDLARRHAGRIWLNYFQAHQRGVPKWDASQQIVQENRTEALDLSRAAIRDGKVVLPRGGQLVEEFATHLTNDAKRLIEDEDTGAQNCRYIRTGPNHFSLAFTYDCLAGMRDRGCRSAMIVGRIEGLPEILNWEF